MKLSDFFDASSLLCDGEFSRLGYVDANIPGVLAYADSKKYLQKAEANPNVSCLIISPELSSVALRKKAIAISYHPRTDFYNVHSTFIERSLYTLPFEPGRGNNCQIHPSAIIADGCRIGDNVVIGEYVIIREPVWIGSGVVIEPGVKLGVEGILYNKTPSGNILIQHAGYVKIHDNVSLMSNSIVVRSIHDTDVTEIEQGALVGLSSIVGHEAKVGKNVVISNQCVIARRSYIGHDSFIGTNVIIKEHLNIGCHARVLAGSVVINDIEDGSSVSGNFATDHKKRMLRFAREERN